MGSGFGSGARKKVLGSNLPPKSFGAAAFFDILMEMLLGLMTSMMPREKALKFLPIVTSAAVFILISNLLGLVPGLPPEPAWAALAAPTTPAALDAWTAAEGSRLQASMGTGPPRASVAPPLGALTARVRALTPPGAEMLVGGGTPARNGSALGRGPTCGGVRRSSPSAARASKVEQISGWRSRGAMVRPSTRGDAAMDMGTSLFFDAALTRNPP